MAVKGQVLHMLRVSRNVMDLARAVAFYREALGFRIGEGSDQIRPAWAQLPDVAGMSLQTVRLRLGQQEIELAAFESSGAPYPPGSNANDLWFQHLAIVVGDMHAACSRLQAHATSPISEHGPQRLPIATGGVTAFKFRDPDAHPLELIQFPAGAGAAVWHQSCADQTVGIDHTAISVAETGRSAAFYRDLLGLTEVSRQVNRGLEQQRLDALPDVAVEVVALQPAAATPHIELLGYLTPRGHAAAAMQLRDIAADRLVLQVQNLPALVAGLQTSGVPIVAAGPVSSADGSHAALIRDPDGHLLVLIE